jgi:hypothetical protein
MRARTLSHCLVRLVATQATRAMQGEMGYPASRRALLLPTGVVKARRRRPSMAEGGAQLAGVRASSRWRPRKKATDRAGCSAGLLGQLGAVLAVLGGDGGGCGGCGDGDEDGEDGGGDNGSGEGAGLRRTDYGHIPPNWNGKYGHFTSIVCISFELDILDYCLSFRILSTSCAQRSAPAPGRATALTFFISPSLELSPHETLRAYTLSLYCSKTMDWHK